MQKKWTVKELIKVTTDYLRKKSIDEPRLTTEILLAHTLNLKRVSLYLNFNQPITHKELSIFRDYIKRRLDDEPVQYIIGRSGFMGFDIETKKGVFIPRQETEILVSETKKWIEANKSGKFILFEIGTGTGAISIFFAKRFENMEIYASDISEIAFECAKTNSMNYHLDEKIFLLTGQVLEPFKNKEKANVLISNPPYIPSSELEKLPEIVKQEPREAFDGGDDGLKFIKRIIHEANDFLKPRSFIALEIGIDQAENVKQLFEKEKSYKDIRIIPDLRGIKRVATAEKL